MENDTARTRICILLGPTASAKSAVGLDVAERIGAEIISADSMQVYRGMDIGTAKPSPAERRRTPHHLIDLRDPWERFSTANYVDLADRAAREIIERGRLPLVLGGTALYLKSLLVGIFDGPSADWEFRERLREEARRLGADALHARLAGIDPQAAAKIHKNDMRRIERALEIYEKTGVPPTKLRSQWASGNLRYDARIAGLRWPKEMLHARIDERVDDMISRGWPDEARALFADPRGVSREASQALGYSQLARVAAGETKLDDAVEEIKRRTRKFAKQQMTWFRSFPGVVWIDMFDEARDRALDTGEAAGKVVEAFS